MIPEPDLSLFTSVSHNFFFMFFPSHLFLSLFLSPMNFSLFVVDFVVSPPFDLPPLLPFFLFVSFSPSVPPSLHPPHLSFSSPHGCLNESTPFYFNYSPLLLFYHSHCVLRGKTSINKSEVAPFVVLVIGRMMVCMFIVAHGRERAGG